VDPLWKPRYPAYVWLVSDAAVLQMNLPCWSHWSPGLTPADKLLLCYEGLLDNIMQGLRHQNPNLCTQAAIKAEHEPVDLKFLSVKVQSIPEQLHKMV
jgi:hypothetical protein